ncbi:transmembrane protein 53-B-like [Biomphalaria glabrata]|uniref:Transmembrane protein 53-B-like n=1 Tax=Biomphalaria glabrata TaxID=6526 RepID=A0A9U8EJI0_BIOGL|nr:transmembrane protein 53-B-like [Biomphalaria glabrata]XP_055900346.1 transmembrane protein 53-B-like [Biomphalaria glabrata]
MASQTLNPIFVTRCCISLIKKQIPLLFAVRQESSLPPLKTVQLNENMQLKTIQEMSSQPRPLVLLYGWMLAKQRHLDKYGNMYHSKGFDVLSLKMRPTQVLIPSRAQKTTEQLLSILQDEHLKDKPLMVHGFSVGGYMYGELLVKLNQDLEKYRSIRSRLVGQIFDSPVDYEGVPSGFARILLKNRVGQKLLQFSLESYLSLFKDSVTRHYIKSSNAFHKNELRIPSLLLYSRADPIGVDTKIELVMKKWRANNIPVMARCWESSPHVSHFHRHPDEYVEAVLKFISSIGLSKPDSEVSKRKLETKKHKEIQQAI